MATNLQRMQAIANALINGTATPAQLGRLGEALAKHGSAYAEYVAADNAGKAGIALREMRRLLLGVIKAAETSEAVQQAASDAGAAVDADFPEAP